MDDEDFLHEKRTSGNTEFSNGTELWVRNVPNLKVLGPANPSK